MAQPTLRLSGGMRSSASADRCFTRASAPHNVRAA